MATSGISFGTVQITTKGFRSYLYWYRNSVDPVANKSVLVIQLWHSTTSTGNTHEGQCYDTFIRWQGNYNYKGQFYIDCNPWTDLGYGPDGYRAYLVYEIWVDVWHNADGSPPWMDVWGRFRTGTTYGPGDCYVNSSDYAWEFQDLDWIDRSGSTCTLSLNSINYNAVTVSMTNSQTIDWGQKRIWIDGQSAPGYVDDGANMGFTGLSPGVTYNIQWKVRRQYNQVWTESNILKVTTPVQIQNEAVGSITTDSAVASVSANNTSVVNMSSYGLYSGKNLLVTKNNSYWSDGIIEGWGGINANAFSLLSYENYMSRFNITGGNYWEIKYLEVKVIPGQQYTLSYEYINEAAYTPISGYTGVPIQILNATPTDSSNIDKQIAAAFMDSTQNSTAKKAQVTFTPSVDTIFLCLNFGYMSDGYTRTIQIGKIQLEKGSVATTYEPSLVQGHFDDVPAAFTKTFSSLTPNTKYRVRYHLRVANSNAWSPDVKWVEFQTHPVTVQVTNAIVSNVTQEGCSLSMASTDSANTMASSFAIYDSTKTTLILDGNINNPAVYTKNYISGLQPGTVYWAQFKLQTVRSEAWSDIVWVQFITIPVLDNFCKLKYSDGTLSDAKPMFHIQDANLCNPLKETYTYRGVTVTNNGDGTFTFNGTATANVDLFISNSTATNTDTSDAIVTKVGDTYTLSREILGGTFTGFALFYISLRKFDGSYAWSYLYAGRSSAKATISEAGYLVGFRMYASAGDVFNNYIVKPKITGCIKISKNKLKLIE